MLNREGIPPFKRPGKDIKEAKRITWGVTSVYRLLGNRAVLGEYQPWSASGNIEKRIKSGPVIPGYFPAIVDLDLFNRVQDAIAGRRITQTTKQSKQFNLWAGIGVCAGCGANLCINIKGELRHDPTVKLSYLICSNKKKGMCQETGVRLDASERVFLEILATTGNLSLVQDDIAVREAQLQAARGRRIAEQEKLDGYIEDYKATRSRIIATLMTEQEQKVLDNEQEIARLEALLAANTVIDRQAFFDRVNLSSRESRNQANALLKRLGIKVAISKAGSRSKLSHYAVYQNEKLIMKWTDDAGKVEPVSYSTDVTMRMFDQGELEEHQLERNVGFGSKTLPKMTDSKAVTKPVADAGQDWTGYDETLPEEAYELLGITAVGDDAVLHDTPLHAPDD